MIPDCFILIMQWPMRWTHKKWHSTTAETSTKRRATSGKRSSALYLNGAIDDQNSELPNFGIRANQCVWQEQCFIRSHCNRSKIKMAKKGSVSSVKPMLSLVLHLWIGCILFGNMEAIKSSRMESWRELLKCCALLGWLKIFSLRCWQGSCGFLLCYTQQQTQIGCMLVNCGFRTWPDCRWLSLQQSYLRPPLASITDWRSTLWMRWDEMRLTIQGFHPSE